MIELGNLTPRRDFIHTHDMAKAIEHLLRLSEVGYEVFNLGRGIEYAVTGVIDSFVGLRFHYIRNNSRNLLAT